jgi:hypothetical protein
MAKKIAIGDDLFDEDIIAFVRKLKKRTKPTELPNGAGTIPGKEYIVQLKIGYSLDGKGEVTSIFLDSKEALGVLRQLRLEPEQKEKPPKQW